MVKNIFNAYIPGHAAKMIPKNLVEIEITINNIAKESEKLIDEKLNKILKPLKESLLSKYINPFSADGLNNWIYRKIKEHIPQIHSITITSKFLVEQKQTKFENSETQDPINIAKYETYVQEIQKPIKATPNQDIQQTKNILNKNNVVNIVTIFCPPYKWDRIQKKKLGFYYNIDLNPFEQNDWQYNYKHYLDILPKIAKKLTQKYPNTKTNIEVYIGDNFINDYNEAVKEQTPQLAEIALEMFKQSCQQYCVNKKLDIKVKRISKLKLVKQTLPQNAPVKSEAILNFLKDKKTNSKSFELVLDLVNNHKKSDFSNKYINNLITNLPDSNDRGILFDLFKCKDQAVKMKKSRVESNLDAITFALKKYYNYYVFGLGVEKTRENCIYISFDTKFTFSSRFFRTKNMPVLNIDPTKFIQKKHQYIDQKNYIVNTQTKNLTTKIANKNKYIEQITLIKSNESKVEVSKQSSNMHLVKVYSSKLNLEDLIKMFKPYTKTIN